MISRLWKRGNPLAVEANKAHDDFTPALGFKALTRLFDPLVSIVMPEKCMRILVGDILLPRPGEKILEFGSGTASNLIALLKKWPDLRLTGLDVDAEVKEIAARKLEKHGLAAGLDLYEGGSIPYEDGEFDAAFTFLVLHHLTSEAKAQALSELHRVIKPGGRIMVGDFAKPASFLRRIAFLGVQFGDGFETTDDNLQGRLPHLIKAAGFVDLVERMCLNTLIGTVRYYCARRP